VTKVALKMGAGLMRIDFQRSLARRANLSPSKLLIPLAFASLLGGMLTLIGTPPNLVVSNQLSDEGLEPFVEVLASSLYQEGSEKSSSCNHPRRRR
jgi:di/tricarboxylate transporter